ncbi:MAG: hypothetical protein ACRD6X_10205, partial [Pyrinomonadaceae bacterium]
VRADTWIMDGNFGRTREIRMRAADTVILLDIPRRVCMYRVIKRAAIYRGKERPDMAEGCNEKIDLEFLLWVWNYRRRSLQRAFNEIALLRNKNVILIRNTQEIESFLERVASQYEVDKG